MSATFTRRAMAALLALPALLLAPRRASAHTVLLSALGDRRAAVRIGRMVLAAFPEMHGADILERLVADHAQGVNAVRAMLAAAIREDFAQGRTLKLDGWLLAQTEARLCALAALKA